MLIRKVLLPQGRFATTALGFGTTSLFAAKSTTERMALLEYAFDLGIRHFDTAPYYGYGEAEQILGRFIRSRRDRVTVTTKFGIQPPRVAGLSTLAAVARRAARIASPIKLLLSKQAGHLVKRGLFSPEDARKSLETSLRALRTDYIDIYLLHEAGEKDVTSELRDFLDETVARGQVRCYGVGSEMEKVLGVALRSPGFARVVQFENNVLHRNLEKFPRVAEQLVLTHGTLGAVFRRLQTLLADQPALRNRWSDRLGANIGDARVLAELMMTFAANANANGLVLFSTKSHAHLEATVRAFSQTRFSRGQIENFVQLVAESGPEIRGQC